MLILILCKDLFGIKYNHRILAVVQQFDCINKIPAISCNCVITANCDLIATGFKVFENAKCNATLLFCFFIQVLSLCNISVMLEKLKIAYSAIHVVVIHMIYNKTSFGHIVKNILPIPLGHHISM